MIESSLVLSRARTEQTTEGARMQLRSAGGESGAIVVSTLAEAWGIIRSGLVEEGVVEDVSAISDTKPSRPRSMF